MALCLGENAAGALTVYNPRIGQLYLSAAPLNSSLSLGCSVYHLWSRGSSKRCKVACNCSKVAKFKPMGGSSRRIAHLS